MSFSVDLWNSFDLIENKILLHYRGLKDFIYMLSERNNSEVNNSHNLKRIHELNFAVTTFDSLLQGIIGFKNDMLNQYTYLTEFCESVKDEIISPLQRFSDVIYDQINKISYEFKSKEKNYNQSKIKLNAAKAKFHSSAKNVENIMLKTEIAKLTQPNSKFDFGFQDALKDAKESENAYIAAVKSTNIEQDEYIRIKKRCFNELQLLEEQMGENIKDSLRKYVVFQVSYIRNMQYDIEKKAKLMESINIQKDIKNYIFKHISNDVPPYKIEFIPYISKLPEFTFENITQDKSKEIIANVNSFISSVFLHESPSDTSNFVGSKVKEQIDTIVSSIINGKEFPKETQKIVSIFVRNKYTRKEIFYSIDQLRLKGNFSLSEVSYEILGRLFLDSLNVLQIEKDYDSMKMIMGLATSLYKINEEQNKQKEFLQKYLRGHTIWGSMQFWKDIIRYYIIEEMHNQKNYNIYNNETIEAKDERIKEIVQSEINSFLFNMISFEINVEIVKEVVRTFCEYYELDEKYLKETMQIIKDFQSKNKEIKNEKNDMEEKKKESK